MTRFIGVDIGGTFTDVAVFADGGLTGFKVPTTEEPADAVTGAIQWVAEDVFLHGTTAATNALLEERGAQIALVTGAGFEDLIEIGRQDRVSLYDSEVDRPPALTKRHLRIGHDGDIAATRAALAEVGAEAVVVGLIDGYRDPSGEQELAVLLREVVDVPVIESTSVSPEFREYERLATALLSGYLTPSVAGYLGRLRSQLPVARSLVMTSAGGLLPFEQGAANAARLVLSGPAGGVVAAAAVGSHHDYQSVISFDMGGTSTDVCRISGGVPNAGPGHEVAGRVNRVPSVPVRTIGAGGGSVGWVDRGGALRVGPRSAGSVPGPAAYGLGGSEPTVTDANLLVGNIPGDLALGGRLRLDLDLAMAAMSRLAAAMGISPRESAVGMLEVVDSHMEHALRAVSVEEGADPRESVLVAFGGAGGLHAGRLARRLDIPKVLIPPLSGLLSAVGLLLAAPRTDAARTVMLGGGDARLEGLAQETMSEAEQHFHQVFGAPALSTRLVLDCRYAGQSHELEIEAAPHWEEVAAVFERTHERHFGFVRRGEPIEVVNLRGVATGVPPLTWDQVVAHKVTGKPSGGDGVWLRPSLPSGFEITGPSVVVEDSSAVLVEAGERLTVLDDGTLEITRE